MDIQVGDVVTLKNNIPAAAGNGKSCGSERIFGSNVQAAVTRL